MDALKVALISQYRASIQMLRKAIEVCSADLWDSEQYHNRTWHVVYHALYFTDLYLYQHLEDRKAGPFYRKGYQDLEYPNEKTPYQREEMLEYLQYVEDRIEPAVAALDLAQEDCGFYWYKVNKLEHQLVNLKHLQHHIGQIQDRIRNHQNQGIGWIRDGSDDIRK